MSRGRAKSNQVRIKQLEQNFVLDGTLKTVEPYEPMLDKHLFFFFANETRLRLLHQQRIINRKFKIVDPHLIKLVRNRAKEQQQAQSFYQTLERLKFKDKVRAQMRLKMRRRGKSGHSHARAEVPEEGQKLIYDS